LNQRLPAPLPEIILGYYETDAAVNQGFARGSIDKKTSFMQFLLDFH
jgi:hypothetical protein